MNAEQKRLADAIDRLHLTTHRLNGMILALDHLLDESSAWPDLETPVSPAIFAVRAALEHLGQAVEQNGAAVWRAATPILDWEVHHA